MRGSLSAGFHGQLGNADYSAAYRPVECCNSSGGNFLVRVVCASIHIEFEIFPHVLMEASAHHVCCIQHQYPVLV